MNSSSRARSRCTLSEYSNIQFPLMNPAGLCPAEIRDWAGETAGFGGMFARRVAESRARRHALQDRGEPEQIERNVEIECRRGLRGSSGAREIFPDVLLLGRDAEWREIEPGEAFAQRFGHAVRHAVVREVRERVAEG